MRAFAGIRVVEFSQVIAGPLSAELLAFLGADVVKVEPPGAGDQARRLMDQGPLGRAGMAPLYQGLNANKRGMALDLKRPAAAEVVRRLVERADVVIENSRPGVMERLGFGYEALRAIKPDLVYCSISGYGQAGPRRDAPAYDGAVQAASGMMSVTGHEGAGPVRVGFPVVDMATGIMGAFAVASALFRRDRTGEGQYLDVSMLDTALFLQSPLLVNLLLGGAEPVQLGNQSVTRIPTADAYPTADGYLQIWAMTEAQQRILAPLVGLDGIFEEEAFASQELLVANGAAFRARLVAALATRPAAEWERELNAAGVPASQILTIPQILADAQLAHRAILQHPAAEGRESVALNAGWLADVDSPSAESPAPTLGQDTAAVLAELGYGPEAIEALRAQGLF